MKNKKEVIKNERIESARKKGVGKTLLLVGIVIFCIGLFIVLLGFSGFGEAAVDFKPRGAFRNIFVIIFGGIINAIGIGLGIYGIVLISSNNDKFDDYAKEKVIPKAKETINKVEPVVTDVIKTVGEGLERTAEEVKETVKKNKDNKKGE